MKDVKWRLTLYQIAVKWRLALYLIAAIVVIIPIATVLVTDVGFGSFYSKVIISIAFCFIIIGKALTAFKKAVEGDAIPWRNLGSIIGLLIILVWIIFM